VGEVDTLTPYTISRLSQWGLEIRGGGTWLGMPKINLLHRDHNGGGSRRVSISDETWMTELVVNEIRKESPDSATVLRACYCGHGRWTEERRRYAESLLGHRLSRRQFFRLHDDGFQRVRDFFADLLAMATI
jgi:hypothetical protein